jgi:hypothetical protein
VQKLAVGNPGGAEANLSPKFIGMRITQTTDQSTAGSQYKILTSCIMQDLLALGQWAEARSSMQHCHN